MTESAAFLVGILGNLLARHIDPARRSLAETISERLSQGGIPPNHDVEKACRRSLGQALQFFAQTLDLHIAVPQTIKEAFANRKDADGKWKPLIEWWHTDQRGWFTEFLKAVESDDALAEFRLPAITRASDLNPAIRSQDHAEWSRQFSAELLRWTERYTPFDQRPACFDSWAKEGWPVSQDDPEATITLYQAWSLFLQDHFKTDEKVRAILTADWLASIDAKLAAQQFSASDLATAIREPLADRLAVLPDLLSSVQHLSSGIVGLGEQSGVLLGLVLEFGKDMRGFREAVLGHAAATHEKLDASLANEAEMKAMLRQLLDAIRISTARVSASTSLPVVRLIARSKLLDADGASRYERLVGRGREKAALTRAWRQDGLNILIYVAWGGVGKTSLVTDWITQLQLSDWPGVEAFFDWSFYSQGTKDQSTASSDLFFRSALRHFGETELADSSDSLEVKADRLAEVIRARRTLLVLDGIEPLQHPRKKGQEEGRLKDGGIETLLRRLAEPGFSGLCLVTTRVPVIDLKRYHDSTVRECELNHLSVRHGAELLHLAGARFAGQQEIHADDEALRSTAIEVKGHAMTLQMLGGYLASAHEGDVLRRDCVDFTRVFADQLEGHAYNVMAAYEEWFETEGERGQRQLSVLRMMGLFDRAADADCIAALRKEGGITGVSDAVAGLTEAEWTQTLHFLAKHRLVFSDRQSHALDAHPLIREYFAKHLREMQAAGFQAAHSRLFDHLCVRTEHRPATLEGLQPLYQAVVHGCLAGRQHEVLEKVYDDRILRGTGPGGNYSTKQLGAIGADLGAVAAFFEVPWSRLSANLSAADQAWLLNEAAFRLRALGRLTEAVEPMRVGLDRRVEQESWKNAAISASNLSELEVTLGRVEAAVADARRSIEFADRSGEWDWRMAARTTAADALHQSGEREAARRLFEQAEALQREDQPEFDLLYSVQGFQYCDLILAPAERTAWCAVGTLDCGSLLPLAEGSPAAANVPNGQPSSDAPAPAKADDSEPGPETHTPAGLAGPSGSRLPQSGTALPALAALAEAERRAKQSLPIAERNHWLLDIALDHLTLARVALYRVLLEPLRPSSFDIRHSSLALDGLRKAGSMHHLPKALLTAALHAHLCGDSAAASRALAEAQQIAERGPMPLYLADVHLHRARFAGMSKDEWRMPNGEAVDPKAELAKARALIEKHRYWRRREELADAEAASVNW